MLFLKSQNENPVIFTHCHAFFLGAQKDIRQIVQPICFHHKYKVNENWDCWASEMTKITLKMVDTCVISDIKM